VKIYLVRHARAEPRSQWEGGDLLRPLSEEGVNQAEALADQLSEDPPTRIVSAPPLRCQETAEPLAVALGLPVEVDERLAEGEGAARALELFPGDDEGPVLLCTHADVIASLLSALELCDPDGRLDCKKGSVWVLEGRGGGYGPSRATYFEPVRRSKRRVSLREATRPRTVRAAALDLGSTSFNLLIADVSRGGGITPVVSEKMMLRLGAVIAEDAASIPKEVFKRAVQTAKELCAVARREKVQRFLPVATAALREAANGPDLAERIGEVLGEPIRILSGEEEARVIFLAFQHRLELGRERVLALDLGGGSLELALGREGRVEQERSLRLGAVRLHQKAVRNDPMKPAEAERVRAKVRRELAACGDAFQEVSGLRAIATGGTARALARLVDEKFASGASGKATFRLPGKTLRALTAELVASNHDQRLRMRGMRKRRADVLPTGALVLATLAEELGLDGFTICDWGLREGVLLEQLATPKGS
jgi:exopolyphosphatase/guanosine-5'-triphosphate,3'-diphosphate pyrophosphatase